MIKLNNVYCTFQWDVTSKPTTDEAKLTFGLLFDTEFAFKVLDKGPSADSPQVCTYSLPYS